jgi:hypothetical protein
MRIPLVEDEEKVSRFITRGLIAERFAVDTAKDGQLRRCGPGWESNPRRPARVSGMTGRVRIESAARS